MTPPFSENASVHLELESTFFGQPQICRDRELEKLIPKQACREEKHFDVFNFTRVGVHSSNDFVPQFLRLLLRVGRALVDVEDVALPVILKFQLRLHSTSPSTSFPAM